MAFFMQEEVRARARVRARHEGLSIEESLAQIAGKQADIYDIFLSQTIRDAEIVLGVVDLLSEMGFTVFCDWITAPEVHREAVTPVNAAFLRKIMEKSTTLLFLDTEGANQSLWMCWELGWFDGQNGHVAILPILDENQKSYRGREFLGLYPYVEIDSGGGLKIVRPSATNRHGVTLFEAPNSTSFNNWREAQNSFMRPRDIDHWGG
jgi:hypothetical protein